jgi:hypothetical protein
MNNKSNDIFNKIEALHIDIIRNYEKLIDLENRLVNMKKKGK